MLKRFNIFGFLCLAVLSLAAATEAAVTADVRVNSIGYLPGTAKHASILNGAAATTWNLRLASNGAIVATGALSAAVTDTDTNEAIKQADFSAFAGTGTYYLEVPGLGQSVNFDIQPDVYNSPLRVSMMGYYGWRCGTAVNLVYGSDTFAHPACHVNDAYLDYIGSPGVKRDGTGGWHDAGDYNKYIVNAGITVGGLLQAWEDFQPNLTTLPLNFIPEHGGAIPDFLAEVKWELNWVLKMQYGPADGRVSHKLSSTGFDPFEMPQADGSTRYYVPYGTAATADFVAMLAKAARIYAPYNAAFATQCQNAATVSWNYLVANPGDVQANQTGFSTGAYTTTDTDDRLWAAAEMWELTGNAATLTDLESRISAQGVLCDPDWDWDNVKNLGIFVYAKSARAGRNAALLNSVKNAIKAAADARVTGCNSSGYGRTLKGNYYWGSNGSIGRSAMVLHVADLLFPNSAYLATAVDQIGFLFGRNYYNRSQVTGLGINPPMNPHHRPSGSDGIVNPWPGLLVGGPGGHSNSATEWTDVQADYFTNEVAINWNGGLVYLLAMCSQPFPPPGTNTPSPTATASPTPLPCGTPVVRYRLRAESTSFTDSTGKVWAADQAYTVGSWGYVGGTQSAPYAGAIAGTPDAGLYQGEHYGNPMEYRFTVPNGLYQVTLKLSENYFTSAGARVFDVQGQGQTVASGVDIFSQVGQHAAMDLTFTVGVNNGVLDIVGTPSADNAHVSAIEVLQLFGGPCVTQTATYTATSSSTPASTPSLTASATRSASPTSSASPTPSVSSSPTASPTASSSPSPSETPTATPTRSPSVSPSSTSSMSPSPSPSPTFTVSPASSATSTFSASPSYTRSPTPTETITAQPSPSSSQTRSPSPSASPSASPSDTAVPPGSSPTSTATVSPSFSMTSSQTQTSTNTPTATESVTPTDSPTFTVTASSSASTTASPSVTPSPSSTASPVLSSTSTETVTPAITFTQTGTCSVSPINTPSSSATPTVTASATPAITVVASATAIAPGLGGLSPSTGPANGGTLLTVTGTAFVNGAVLLLDGIPLSTSYGGPGQLSSTLPPHAPGTVLIQVRNPDGQVSATLPFIYLAGLPTPTQAAQGQPRVDRVQAVPQPQRGPQFAFAVLIEGGTADRIDVRVYSSGYVLVAAGHASGSFRPGWNYPVTFEFPGLSNGIYFTRAFASADGRLEKAGKAGKLLVLR